MIDFRHETFLEVCRIKSFTKAAEFLHITQPAVSQHIKYLEQVYGGKLFEYNGKNISLTKKGELLYEYTLKMAADSKNIKNIIEKNEVNTQVSFGATLTIGEFILPDILAISMNQNNKLHLNMAVENTKSLLSKIDNGDISFAFLEGFFDKAHYGYKLFRNEQFIGVCSAKSRLSKGEYTLDDILNEKLILREHGSGTRDIFEHFLKEKNLSRDSFNGVIEIGNMNAIKRLTEANEGITFMYYAAVKDEIHKGTLKKIDIVDFNVSHEFNFVYIKNSVLENLYLKWFDFFNEIQTQILTTDK